MTSIKVECTACSKTHQVDGTEFKYESVDVDERDMGQEITYEAEYSLSCDCDNEIEITHRYWEYPVGAVNYKETDVSGAQVVHNDL